MMKVTTFPEWITHVKLVQDIVWTQDGPQLNIPAGTICVVKRVESPDHTIVTSPDGHCFSVSPDKVEIAIEFSCYDYRLGTADTIQVAATSFDEAARLFAENVVFDEGGQAGICVFLFLGRGMRFYTASMVGDELKVIPAEYDLNEDDGVIHAGDDQNIPDLNQVDEIVQAHFWIEQQLQRQIGTGPFWHVMHQVHEGIPLLKAIKKVRKDEK